MLLDLILNDSYNYIHVQSLMRSEHEVLINTPDSLIIHFIESDIYIVESTSDSLTEIASTIKSYNPNLIETTNQALFKMLRNDFIESYECYQYGPYVGVAEGPDDNLRLLSKKDLQHVCDTYHEPEYMGQLFERGRLLGYYKDDELIGYIAKHIDGTLGALYVEPKYRGHGYGQLITKTAAYHFSDPLLYSQVIDNNTKSINMHIAMDMKPLSKKICWMYNKTFLF